MSQIVAGDRHTVLCTASGELWSWGGGLEGQLGHGEDCEHLSLPQKVTSMADEIVTSVYAGGCHTAVITAGGDLWTCGLGMCGQLGLGGQDNENVPMKVPLFGVVACACGFSHTLALTRDGAVFAFGDGQNNRLGLEATAHFELSCVALPLRIEALPASVVGICAGYRHSAAWTNTGALYTWGEAPFPILPQAIITTWKLTWFLFTGWAWTTWSWSLGQ